MASVDACILPKSQPAVGIFAYAAGPKARHLNCQNGRPQLAAKARLATWHCGRHAGD